MFDDYDFNQIYQEKETSNSLVIMMCGIAGSGKTTFSKILEQNGFVRLSIDEEIWRTHGRWGIDFPMQEFEKYCSEAENKLFGLLIELIKGKKDVVIDFSFWDRDRRERYKKSIEDFGGKWLLVYLKVEESELRKRLLLRSKRFDANAFPVSDELLLSYLKGFEVPKGEGEIVINN